jgi:hypothetical protein
LHRLVDWSFLHEEEGVRPVSRRIEVGILAFNRGFPVSGRSGVSFGDFFSVGFVDFVLLQGLLLVV